MGQSGVGAQDRGCQVRPLKLCLRVPLPPCPGPRPRHAGSRGGRPVPLSRRTDDRLFLHRAPACAGPRAEPSPVPAHLALTVQWARVTGSVTARRWCCGWGATRCNGDSGSGDGREAPLDPARQTPTPAGWFWQEMPRSSGGGGRSNQGGSLEEAALSWVLRRGQVGRRRHVQTPPQWPPSREVPPQVCAPGGSSGRPSFQSPSHLTTSP